MTVSTIGNRGVPNYIVHTGPQSIYVMSPHSSESSSRTSRSKLYERYDVELPTVSPSNDTKKSKWRGWFKTDKDEDGTRQQLPPDQWTNVEVIKYIFKNSSFKSKLIAILVIMILSSIIKSTLSYRNNDARNKNDLLEMKKGPIMTKYGIRPDTMDADSHKRSNPFAPPGHQSYMEGVLEVKRVKKRVDPAPPTLNQQKQNQPQQQKQQSLQLEDKALRHQGNMLTLVSSHETPEKRVKGRKSLGE